MSKKVYVYDLETLPDLFTATFLDKDNDEVVIIHSNQQDYIKNLMTFLTTKVSGLIGYNCISFDGQILQDIYLGVCKTPQEIWKRADFHIKNEKNHYYSLFIKHLDLYLINHYNNKNRRTSLKWCEFGMRMTNIEDMPVTTDINAILSYNLNDCIATKKLYERCKPEIDLRKQLSIKYNLDFLNLSDSSIGSELLLELYCKYSNKNKASLRKLRTPRYEILVKDIIFPYIAFECNEFKKALNIFSNSTIYPGGNTPLFTIKYNNIDYTFAAGGIHGSLLNTTIKADDDYIIMDCDVTSMYPSIMIVNNLYPEHLDDSFINILRDEIVNVRVLEKKKPKKEQDTIIVNGYKLAANSTYGKTMDQYSWMYDPQVTFTVTVNGQLMLAMLVEKLSKISTIIQANTDGVTVKLHRNAIDEYYKICNEWEKLTKLDLEYVEYKSFFIRDVNNYISVTTKGDVKLKGAFEYNNIPLHKNASAIIIPYAVVQYLVNNIPVERTIMNHNNIFDFCIGVRAKSNSWYELKGVKSRYIHERKLSKTVRFFISTNGSVMMKHYSDGKVSHVNAPLRNGNKFKYRLVTIFNHYYESDNYNIDYAYYIYEANKLIKNVQMTNELTLF
jgi:hypothetical protein